MIEQTHPTPDTNRFAKLYLENGLSLAKIASRIGISKTTLRDRFRSAGIPIRKGSETRCLSAPTGKLIGLYEQGSTPAQIAKQLGITKSAVISRLIRNGHKLRPRGGTPGRMKLPNISTAQIVQAWRNGSTPGQIANALGTSRATVEYRLKLAGCNFRKRKHRLDLPEKEIIRLYLDEGLSMENIAEKFKVGHATIYRTLQKQGVHRRTRTEHMKAWHASRKDKLARFEALQATSLPHDWTTKTVEWVFVGLILVQQTDYMSNEELAERLDASGFKCRFSQDEDGTWGVITRPGYAANVISAIRTWVGRRGKTPKKK